MSSPDTQVTESPAVAAAEAELDAILKGIPKESESAPKNEDKLGEGDIPPQKPSEPEKQVQSEPQRPRGYEPIDLETASKEEIKERLDYLYGQAKGGREKEREYDKQIRALAEHNRKLEDGLNELWQQNAQRTTRDELTQYEQAKTSVLAAIEDAKAYGDTKREAELFTQYARLENWKSEFDAAQRQPAQQPQRQQQPQPQPQYSNEEAIYIKQLSEEEGEDGAPLRPWLKPSDPNFNKAVELAKKITKDLEDRGVEPALTRIMPRLEKYMNAKPAPQAAPVLGNEGGNLTPPNKNKTIALSNEQKSVARKLGIDFRKSGVDTEAQMAKLATLKRVRLEDI